jgi:hypothetical protein
MSKRHPFETAGLGKAPFRFAGMAQQDRVYGQIVSARMANGLEITTKPGGTCAYCGQAILRICRVKSADGREFGVGVDCARKVDPALGRKAASATRKAVAANTRATLAELVAANATRLATESHPYAAGRTLLDWATRAQSWGPAAQRRAIAALRPHCNI